MDDFSGILARDFGFRPGKSTPMAASKPPAAGSAARHPSGTASWNKSRSGWSSDSLLGDHGVGVSGSRGSPPAYDDVFLGGNSAAHGRSASSASPSTDFDSIFDGFKDSAPKPSNSSSPPTSSMPVYDKPVYDDDIFEGVPGLKSTSSVNYDDVFASLASASDRASSPPYEDLLGNLGKPVSGSNGVPPSAGSKDQKLSGFDDLIPGFRGSSSPNRREPSESRRETSAFSSAKPTAPVEEDPFKVFESVSASTYSSSGLFTDPLEHVGRPVNSGSTKVNSSSTSGESFDGFGKSVPSFVTEASKYKRNQSPQKYSQDMNSGLHSLGRKPPHQEAVDAFENILPNMQPSKPSVPQKPVSRSRVHNTDIDDNNVIADQSPKYYEHMETVDDIWLTVAEIPLFTQPTNAPPPSRPPPPLVTKKSPANKKDNEFSMQSTQRHFYSGDSVRKSVASPIDEHEDFATGKPQTYAQNRSGFFMNDEEEFGTNSAAAASAAAMKEAMGRAEAKFKHAKEVRERERDAKIAKTRESQQQEREPYGQDAENSEEQESLDHEREEKEKEQRRLERVREQELERERERKAVERATREARERAAAEARQRAEREKAEAERRERERAAVQRAAAEARQRAAAEARQRVERERAERERAEKERADKERAERERAERERTERERAERERMEKEVSDARERAAAERLRAERMAVERAAAEARKRAAEDARRRAAAAAAATAAEEKQKKSPEEDLESFFGMGARATSAPAQRPNSSDTLFNPQPQTKVPHNTASVSSSTIRKVSSTANIVDDLSSMFGGPPSSGEFQEIEGETEERRRARLERHQRTAERAQKALAEKNERDRQAQMEQAERHRIGETLDFEIKRWAAGKEGNLRALLSTLQYVLWPECGWQPVSLTDLITAAAVKKVYRKATLCIHPDKVQQKGATIQQKYIAEKVFDLLKEAWNKFNSEELF